VEVSLVALIAFGPALVAFGAYCFWRYVWFFRNPRRASPSRDGLVAAADGTVVYVKRLAAAEDVILVKQGLSARLADIVMEDVALPKLLIGVFMSPFDVHYNRAPLGGTIEFVRHHPGRGRNMHMGPMHWRVLTRREPYYAGSAHIVCNERQVTKLRGSLRGTRLSCYIVQIAAKTVAGIDSYVRAGDKIGKGEIFGMIRIGSQVDLVIPWHDDMTVRVRPGDRVRAGETILVD
jgi:phosphatidylserine decarboxylase